MFFFFFSSQKDWPSVMFSLFLRINPKLAEKKKTQTVPSFVNQSLEGVWALSRARQKGEVRFDCHHLLSSLSVIAGAVTRRSDSHCECVLWVMCQVVIASVVLISLAKKDSGAYFGAALHCMEQRSLTPEATWKNLFDGINTLVCLKGLLNEYSVAPVGELILVNT